jgi:uncharacterized alkaline shock family protein YloU
MSDLSTTTTTGGMTSSSAMAPGTPAPSRLGESRLPVGGQGQSSLRSEYGTTTIADGVVAKIAALATREVNGVAELGGSVSGAISGVMGRITGSGTNEPRTAGVGVEVGETQAAVDLTVKVLYPASIHEVADAVRQNVKDRIESMTGLQVVEVNIAIVDLLFPGEQRDEEAAPTRSSRVE